MSILRIWILEGAQARKRCSPFAHSIIQQENKKENATEIRFGTPPIFWLPCQRAGLVAHSACSPARNAIHSTFNVSAPSRFIERCVAGSTPRVRAVKFVALVVLSCGIKGASQKGRPIATNSPFSHRYAWNCELFNFIDEVIQIRNYIADIFTIRSQDTVISSKKY